ncbi:Bulb-type lectin domain-containing protein [Cynara cardunculus var. scolymus]|uniref:Bulb-type lectin domain-containing protein n=1 Tax=Cynara cardunculus var. scolymus TaxID=59895 RepID=A0A103YDC9_CYNCS|nr:Bulb-type lectin domain-containing protein [Cynara cardunculus var. scolymus]
MISTSSTSVSVVLLDNGNLVLRNGSRSSPPIWQSFDHPAHTLLPHSKIGYDKRTHRKQVITSWRSREDPAVGLFSLEIDPNVPQWVLRWNKSVQYWTSGYANRQIFSSMPEIRLNDLYNFSYINNENESYFDYSVYDPSIISRCLRAHPAADMVWKCGAVACDLVST